MMRTQTFSVVLVVLLALSHFSYGQSASQEYLKTISDLVSQKGLGDVSVISPLQTLYYTQLLQPGFLWRDLTTMVFLNASSEYDNAFGFMDYFSNSLAQTLKWSYAEPINTEDKAFSITQKAGPFRKEANTEIPVTVKIAPLSEAKTPVTEAAKSAPTVVPVKSHVTEMPAEFEWIKGADYVEYSSVGFYRNAAIIHPSYQAEMASLAEHMKADLNIKLRIHGHCNGDATRTIIAAGIMTKFFEISDQDQKRTVTAKELTELRASYAKRYLISQGVSPERIQVIGAGSEKMIYDTTSEHAHYNDRVELELFRTAKL